MSKSLTSASLIAYDVATDSSSLIFSIYFLVGFKRDWPEIFVAVVTTVSRLSFDRFFFLSNKTGLYM